MKQIYVAGEDVLYGLSALTGEIDINSPQYVFRTVAFADLIENMILSEKMIFDDISEEDGNFTYIKSIIKRNYLQEDIIETEKLDLPFSEHSPHLMQDMATVAGFEPKTLNHLSADEQQKFMHEQLEMFWNNAKEFALPGYVASFPRHKIPELLDIISFVGIDLNLLDGEEVKNSWNKTFSELGKKANEDLVLEDQIRLKALIIAFSALTESALTISVHKNIPNVPSPLKANYLTNSLLFAPSSKIFLDKLNDLKHKKMVEFNDFMYNKYMRMIRMPLLFNYVISKSNSIQDVFAIAKDLKYSKEIQSYRNWCTLFDDLLSAGKQEDALKILTEVDSLVKRINDKTCVENNRKQISVQLSFPPAISFNVKMMEKNRKYMGFLKKVYDESMSPIVAQEKVKKIIKDAANKV